jgi:hypothetical protein
MAMREAGETCSNCSAELTDGANFCSSRGRGSRRGERERRRDAGRIRHRRRRGDKQTAEPVLKSETGKSNAAPRIGAVSAVAIPFVSIGAAIAGAGVAARGALPRSRECVARSAAMKTAGEDSRPTEDGSSIRRRRSAIAGRASPPSSALRGHHRQVGELARAVRPHQARTFDRDTRRKRPVPQERSSARSSIQRQLETSARARWPSSRSAR